jgi:hypothetical protein
VPGGAPRAHRRSGTRATRTAFATKGAGSPSATRSPSDATRGRRHQSVRRRRYLPAVTSTTLSLVVDRQTGSGHRPRQPRGRTRVRACRRRRAAGISRRRDAPRPTSAPRRADQARTGLRTHASRAPGPQLPIDASVAPGDRRSALPLTPYRQDPCRVDLRQAPRPSPIRSGRAHREARPRIYNGHGNDPRSTNRLRSREPVADRRWL